MATRLYCYVDETGIDTQGELFIVGVVITTKDPLELRTALERIEGSSGKGRRKWTHTRPQQRIAFIEMLLGLPLLKGSLAYSVYHGTTAYVSLTREATARTILATVGEDHQATIWVDGLPRSQVSDFAVAMHRLGRGLRS